MKNESHIVLFDGDCSFCNHWVLFITKRDPKKKFKFYSLQSALGKNLRKKHQISENLDTLIYIKKNQKAFIKSAAVLRITLKLKFPWYLAFGFIIVPPIIRNWIYDLVAKNRNKLFKTDTCEIPND